MSESDTISWRFAPMGEAALLVEAWPVHPLTNRSVLALAALLEGLAWRGVQSLVPAINSLLIMFDPLEYDIEHLQGQVAELLHGLSPLPEVPERVITVPVRYGGSSGPDLEDVAAQLQISPREVVARHTAQIYRVMMIGFAPGFPYAGPLPDNLVLPRRATPRQAVPAGTVAIAAGLTGIYPVRLPGGWHLIGYTSLPLFDARHAAPSTLVAGDGVRFEALADGVQP